GPVADFETLSIGVIQVARHNVSRNRPKSGWNSITNLCELLRRCADKLPVVRKFLDACALTQGQCPSLRRMTEGRTRVIGHCDNRRAWQLECKPSPPSGTSAFSKERSTH